MLFPIFVVTLPRATSLLKVLVGVKGHHLKSSKFSSRMSEKLCLQWNDFQNNVKSAFGSLRKSHDFVDVTLASEDGQQIQAHRVILAASSPFFQTILQKNKHTHPLIYMRGVRSDTLTALVDFLYYGEANVYQEDLDTFLAIAEELQLKILQGSTDQNVFNEAKEDVLHYQSKETNWTNQSSSESRPASINKSSKSDRNALVSQTIELMYGDLQELDQTVNSMKETSQNMIETGNRKTTAKICKKCGKEGHHTNFKRHIELYHLEGVSIPCKSCEKTFRSRATLQNHVSTLHKNITV